MTTTRSQDIAAKLHVDKELAILRDENQRLRRENDRAFEYVRHKIDDLLAVIGTQALLPEELDNQSLVDLDPLGILTDTFEHVLDNAHRTNQKLHFAHNEIQTIFDTVGVAIMVLDTNGRVVAYNQRVKDMMLVSDVDIKGSRCAEYICQGRTSDSRCIFKAVLASERELHYHDWPLNGHSFDVVGRAMFNDAGRLSNVVISYKNVTARRDAEVALMDALLETQEANAKLHGFLRSAGDAILVTDADENIVLMNKMAEQLFGVCLNGKHAVEKLDILQSQGLVACLKDAAQSSEALVVRDIVFSETGGREHLYQARVSIINTPKSGFRGCVTILHDVTEQRAIERMKSDFVSTAAHELRTPLATIIGYAELLLMKEDCSDEELGDYLGMIHDKAERLSEIVSDLLDISRIESGEAIPLNLERCHLGLLCTEVVEYFRPQHSQHTFEIEASSTAVMQADRFATLQILENLLSNAVKYSPEGGLIKVSVSQSDCACQCIVTDQGIGMTSAQVEKAYDKFYRVDATDTAVSGTGLGLTIVKHLVDAQKGEIDISSAPGRGTTVTVSFPCAEIGL